MPRLYKTEWLVLDHLPVCQYLANQVQCIFRIVNLSGREEPRIIAPIHMHVVTHSYLVCEGNGTWPDTIFNPYRTDGKKLSKFWTCFRTETAIRRHRHTHHAPKLVRNGLQPSAAHLCTLIPEILASITYSVFSEWGNFAKIGTHKIFVTRMVINYE